MAFWPCVCLTAVCLSELDFSPLPPPPFPGLLDVHPGHRAGWSLWSRAYGWSLSPVLSPVELPYLSRVQDEGYGISSLFSQVFDLRNVFPFSIDSIIRMRVS